jgi:hypothetical protein
MLDFRPGKPPGVPTSGSASPQWIEARLYATVSNIRAFCKPRPALTDPCPAPRCIVRLAATLAADNRCNALDNLSSLNLAVKSE